MVEVGTIPPRSGIDCAKIEPQNLRLSAPIKIAAQYLRLSAAQRQLPVKGTDIVRPPGTLAGPYGDLEAPVEPDGEAGVSDDTRRLRERIANTSKALLHSLDELVGAVIGKRLERAGERGPARICLPYPSSTFSATSLLISVTRRLSIDACGTPLICGSGPLSEREAGGKEGQPGRKPRGNPRPSARQ